jgi:hypothetical protein
VSHDTAANLGGANPFRLKDQNLTLDNVQFSCSYSGTGCHVTGTIGPRTGQDISTLRSHTRAEMIVGGGSPKYAWSFAPTA